MTTPPISRRQFIASTAVIGAVGGVGGVGAAALARPAFGWRLTDTTLRVLSIGVVGTIGDTDRKNIAKHPKVEIVGLSHPSVAAALAALDIEPRCKVRKSGAHRQPM